MKRILITGACAPVSIDLSRRFHAAGHEVFLCDSNRFPVGRFTNQQHSFHRVPSPRHDTAGSQSREFVFKPCYSRFAASALVGPSAGKLSNLTFEPAQTWVAQEKIKGTEVCSFSLANKGRLLAHASYKTPYRAGQGGGIFFEPLEHFGILNYVEAFLRQTNFTGQIGFDFIIDSEDHPWVIECNPRSTSGIHLFAMDSPMQSDVRMIGAVMPIWGSVQAIMRLAPGKFIRDFRSAKDVLTSKNDRGPMFYIPLTFAELGFKAIKKLQSLQAASTEDMGTTR